MATDAEKELYSLAKSMDVTSDASSNLMASMKAIKESAFLTVLSRMASGVLPTFWAIQNKFRAIADAFVGYDKLSNKMNETTLKQIKSFSELTKVWENFPVELLDDFKSIEDGIPNIGEMFNEAGDMEEALDIDEWLAIAEKKFSEFDMFKTMVGEHGPEVLKEEIQNALQIEKDRMDKKKDVLKEEFNEKMEMKKAFEKFGLSKDKDKDKFQKMLVSRGMALKKIITGLPAFIGKGVLLFGKALIYFTAIGLVLGILVMVIREAWPSLKRQWKQVKGMFKVLYDGIIMFFHGMIDLIAGVLSGDLHRIAEGVAQLFGSFILIITGLITSGLGLLILSLTALFGGLGESIWGKLDEGQSRGAAVASLLIIVGLMGAAVAWIASGTWILTTVQWLLVGLAGLFVKSLGKHASGGTVRTPMQLVGENGPELVSLPMGSRVHTNAESRKMAGGNTINVHVNGRVGASDAEIRDIADKVGREISLKMNRTTNTQMRF